MSSATEARAFDEILRDAVASGVTPGVVAIVSDDRGVRYLGAAGSRDVDTSAPITGDTVFRIASMTKVVTAVAALQLEERGLLALDRPVGDILPAFDSLRVLEGFEGDLPRLRRPKRRATIGELITHRSGLSYDTWNADLLRYHALTGVPNVGTGLRDTFEVPLVCDPGDRFNYSTGMDWTGLVIEELSGQPLDRYFEEHIFDPLGMRDTAMELTAEQRSRCAVVHVRDDRGDWVTDPADNAAHPEFFAGGHGLYSTAPDFDRLQRMLLGADPSGNASVLRDDTVRRMFADQIGGLSIPRLRSVLPPFSADVDLGESVTAGFGMFVTTRRRAGMRDVGSGGWAGVYNTEFWVDRARRRSAALYTQTLPFFDPGFVDLVRRFERAVYDAIE
jgi:methyl acetate hydrolase